MDLVGRSLSVDGRQCLGALRGSVRTGERRRGPSPDAWEGRGEVAIRSLARGGKAAGGRGKCALPSAAEGPACGVGRAASAS